MIDPELRLLIRELAEQPLPEAPANSAWGSMEKYIENLILAARRIDTTMRCLEWSSPKSNRVTMSRPFHRD